MKITLYGILAEIAGQNQIEVGSVRDVRTLRSEMSKVFPGFNDHTFHVAVNRRKAGDNFLLGENDEIALLPPFAGG